MFILHVATVRVVRVPAKCNCDEYRKSTNRATGGAASRGEVVNAGRGQDGEVLDRTVTYAAIVPMTAQPPPNDDINQEDRNGASQPGRQNVIYSELSLNQ